MSTTENMAVAALRNHFQITRSFLEGTLQDVTNEQAAWKPEGKPSPIGAQYAHVITTEDGVVNALLRQGAPLAVSAWVGRTGLNELPPQAPPWDKWAERVEIDLAALKTYAQAVYAATDAYLNSLQDKDLEKPLDLSAMGLGQQTVGSILTIVAANAAFHCGEIACIKGLRGAVGYPM